MQSARRSLIRAALVLVAFAALAGGPSPSPASAAPPLVAAPRAAAACGTAYVFVKVAAAADLGHVAFGYTARDMQPRARLGSVDGFRWDLNKTSTSLGFDSPERMVRWARENGYDWYATREVARCNPQAAAAKADEVRRGFYSVVGLNCLDATYDALRAFGVPASAMPDPSDDPIPNDWFDILWEDRGWELSSL